MKDKDKTPLVHCVTPDCRGYITFLATLKGPIGQEQDKYPFFLPTTVCVCGGGRGEGGCWAGFGGASTAWLHLKCNQ